MNQNTEHTGFISRLNAWLVYKGSDQYNRQVDERKQSLFEGLSGKVLEIGPGTGANLEYYSHEVSLIGLEPNPHMQSYLKERAHKLGKSIEVVTGKAEKIPLDDESVDTVVSTLVLCSTVNLEKPLAEVKRVLKPGGRFLFIEHVAAPAQTFLHSLQRWITPLWIRLVDGCHPDRETWKAIERAGFEEVNIEHFRLSRPVVGPHIVGRAIKRK